MVRKAEEFAEEDKKVKEKIDTRNVVATYVYNMKNQVTDNDKLADKLEANEKDKIETVPLSIREQVVALTRQMTMMIMMSFWSLSYIDKRLEEQIRSY
nr:luminal-binding protein 5-like [Tanacetum cinerariifolium]